METVSHGHFMACLVRLGRITRAEAYNEENQFLADNEVARDSKLVAKATEAHSLTLAELALIFKGA
ncbi:hypothetical protein [Sulfitobacter faviae]|uniref:hypothetical protein n=1 Tax=Sulfitobacter faviae TaxID=1775881 RepID=UPI00398CB4C7